jgi:hypothetical protein
VSAGVRRALGAVVLLVCLAIVVVYQLSRPVAQAGDSRVFVPSPEVYKKLPPSLRVTVGDAYWLYLIQYYGEHYSGDYEFESLPELLDLVTALNPEWERPYLFGAYALLDLNGGKGDPAVSYDYLLRGYEANPRNWLFPFNLAIFAYWFGDKLPQLEGQDPNVIAGQWMEKAAQLPGSPPSAPRLAAALYGRTDARGKAATMWAQVFDTGDEYARKKAVASLDALLPSDPAARAAWLGGLASMMSDEGYTALVDQLEGVSR